MVHVLEEDGASVQTAGKIGQKQRDPTAPAPLFLWVCMFDQWHIQYDMQCLMTHYYMYPYRYLDVINQYMHVYVTCLS